MKNNIFYYFLILSINLLFSAQPCQRAIRTPASLSQILQLLQRNRSFSPQSDDEGGLPHRSHWKIPRRSGGSLSLRELPQGEHPQRRSDGRAIKEFHNREER